jgi:hypothetical protein
VADFAWAEARIDRTAYDIYTCTRGPKIERPFDFGYAELEGPKTDRILPNVGVPARHVVCMLVVCISGVERARTVACAFEVRREWVPQVERILNVVCGHQGGYLLTLRTD